MTGGSRSPSMFAADGGETLPQTDGGAELRAEVEAGGGRAGCSGCGHSEPLQLLHPAAAERRLKAGGTGRGGG